MSIIETIRSRPSKNAVEVDRSVERQPDTVTTREFGRTAIEATVDDSILLPREANKKWDKLVDTIGIEALNLENDILHYLENDTQHDMDKTEFWSHEEIQTMLAPYGVDRTNYPDVFNSPFEAAKQTTIRHYEQQAREEVESSESTQLGTESHLSV